MREPTELDALIDQCEPTTGAEDAFVNRDLRPPTRDYIEDPDSQLLREIRDAQIWENVHAGPDAGHGPPSLGEMILRVLEAIGEMAGHGFSDRQVETLRTRFRGELIQPGMPFHDADADKADNRLRKAVERARKARSAIEPR